MPSTRPTPSPGAARTPDTSRRPRGTRASGAVIAAGLLLAATALAGTAAPAAAASDPGTSRPFPAPVGSCYTTPTPTSLAQNQLAAIYGLTPLWDAGHKGAGTRMAVLDPGSRPELGEVDQFKHCQGVDVPVTVKTIGGGSEPTVSAEATLDLIVGMLAAPELDGIYLFSSRSDLENPLLHLLEQAVDPANTGGERVDVISISFDDCEPWLRANDPGYVQRMEAALQQAAQSGISVFVAGGDSGSASCADHPVLETDPLAAEAAVFYPASSPWVVNVGGTQMEIERGADGSGRVLVEKVWNEPDVETPDGRDAGGGGHSVLFAMPEWQQRFGLPGTMRSTPDVTGLAGSPYYGSGEDESFWYGTSAASPYTAGAWAVIISALEAEGLEHPGFLTPLLYTLGTDDYAAVFRDITVGDNDPWGLVGCCAAGTGYDNASGLGSLRFDALAKALGAPTAALTFSPRSATFAAGTSLTVTLDASASTTPGGRITSYEWDTDGDGAVDATTATPTYAVTVSAAGTSTPSVTIRTNLGRAASASVSFTISVAATPVTAAPTFAG
jgi:subtilase family serine protease